MAKMDAVVIFDYDKQQDDEISLKVGEIVLGIKQVDEGWCEGTVNGIHGLFPDNFVKKRQTGHTTAPNPTAAPPTIPVEQPGAVLRDSKDKSRRAKVTYSYVAENPDELSLQPGQTVEIIAEEEEGWWRGKTGGKEGVFPSNFVELVSDQGKSPPSTTDGLEKPEGPARQSVFGPKVMPNFNPLEARKQLKSTASKPSLPPVAAPGPKPEEPKKAAPPPPPSQTRPPLPPPPAVERAKVIFDYTAEQDDEVDIKIGDIVEVLKKDVQEGWWEIQHGDQKGLIPDNFVEVLPPQTSPSTPSKKPHTPTTDNKPDPPLPAKEPAPALPSRPTAAKKPPPPPMEAKRPPLPRQESVETKRPALPPHKDSKVKLDEEEGADFGVPSTQPLDNSAVKSRPKKSVGSRPPSRSNLHLDDASSQPQEEPQLSPWQQEMQKRKANKPQPPPPKPSFSRKPPPTKPGAKPPLPPEAETKPPPPSKPTVTAAPRSTAAPIKPAEAKPPPPLPPSETVQSPPSSTESGAWKEAFEKLKEELDRFKHEYLKDIEILTEDLDKERKLRAALEIEVDRLKKSRDFRNKL